MLRSVLADRQWRVLPSLYRRLHCRPHAAAAAAAARGPEEMTAAAAARGPEEMTAAAAARGPEEMTAAAAARGPEEMKRMQENTYFDKYAEKLKLMQRASPSEFQQKVDELDASKDKLSEAGEQMEEQLKSDLAAAQTKPKRLDRIMKVELLDGKTVDEVTQIWKKHHEMKPFVFAVLETSEYQELHKHAKLFPNFVYPLPRGQGYEFFIQQFSGNECHFTPLCQFQKNEENAPSCLSLTHYTELQDKGIVLMRGEPDTDVISVREAQLLALQLKMYYGMHAGLKFNLVRQFANAPETFRHMDLVREFENYKKDATLFCHRQADQL